MLRTFTLLITGFLLSLFTIFGLDNISGDSKFGLILLIMLSSLCLDLFFDIKESKKENEETKNLGEVYIGEMSHFGYAMYYDTMWGTQIYTKNNYSLLITKDLKDLEKNEKIFIVAYEGGVSKEIYFRLKRENGEEYGFSKSNFNLEKFNKLFEKQKLKTREKDIAYT